MWIEYEDRGLNLMRNIRCIELFLCSYAFLKIIIIKMLLVQLKVSCIKNVNKLQISNNVN